MERDSHEPVNGHPQGPVPVRTVPSQKCKAKTTSGAPCRKWAIVGGTVCPTHGGSAPQVRDAARRRLLELAPAAVETLHRNLNAESEAVQVRAADSVLDRTGLNQAHTVQVEAGQYEEPGALDEAIQKALIRRGLMVPEEDIEDAEIVED